MNSEVENIIREVFPDREINEIDLVDGKIIVIQGRVSNDADWRDFVNTRQKVKSAGHKVLMVMIHE